jgi:hypothetical protein
MRLPTAPPPQTMPEWLGNPLSCLLAINLVGVIVWLLFGPQL